MTTRRPFSRPRTKVYDCNYNMGETYYKPTLDSLDRRSRTVAPPRVAETMEIPEPPVRVQRPKSMIDLESVEGRVQAGVASEMEEEMASTIRRLRAARAAAVPTPEESFENTFHQRTDAVKKRFSEKMLDSVGINGAMSDDEHLTIRKRVSRLAAEESTIPSIQWTAIDDSTGRALRSRARLADLEAEMEEMVERGAARERRAANLRQLLAEDAENIAASIAATQSQSLASKKMVTSITTEKRSLAY